MVDTIALNGDVEQQLGDGLPDVITIDAADGRRIPSPGTQRALKAETGKTFDEMCGEKADGADRIQTLIWIKLRRTRPALRWGDCAEVDVIIEEGALGTVDPTKLAVSAALPPSADSGE